MENRRPVVTISEKRINVINNNNNHQNPTQHTSHQQQEELAKFVQEAWNKVSRVEKRRASIS